MASNEEKVEEELTCSICMELFEDPVTFPCTHTFCRHCVQDLLNSDDESVCPNCRGPTGIPPGGSVSDLPKSIIIANLVSIHKNKQSVSVPVVSTPVLQVQPAPPPNQPLYPSLPAFNNASAPPMMTNQRIQPFGGVPHHVTCCACGKDVYGVRYRCCECADFDLCSKCEAAGSHDKHDMIKVVNPKTSFPRIVFRTQTFFRRIKCVCDVCNKTISGIRYNCCQCNDFDLCKPCERKNRHPDHDMRRVVSDKVLLNNIPTEVEARTMMDHGSVHPRVTCDVCGCAVRGFRFKCSVCANYDLCAKCLAKGSHMEHDMRSIDPPS